MRIRSLFDVLSLGVLGACASVPNPRSPSPVAGSPVELVVAATTDIHGRVRGWNYDRNASDTAVGLARAATIVDSLRDAAPGRVVLVDAGDIIQGNALGVVAARVAPPDAAHPVIAAMNAMGYDAAAVGNHEFNYGVPFLERVAGQAHFPLLAANARRPDGTRAFRGWTIVERAGVKVGIVGATTPGSMVWDRDNLRGRVVLGDIVPAVREAVTEARGAGAQIIVVTMHSGLAEPASYDTAATGLPSDNVAARVAREVPGVDLIAYGHSHKEMADTTINGVLLMQAKNWV
jgi:2',3'-cyclic-nucleotide 2'-phosphodiesterase (5'-nucleotidase family)